MSGAPVSTFPSPVSAFPAPRCQSPKPISPAPLPISSSPVPLKSVYRPPHSKKRKQLSSSLFPSVSSRSIETKMKPNWLPCLYTDIISKKPISRDKGLSFPFLSFLNYYTLQFNDHTALKPCDVCCVFIGSHRT